MNDYQSATDIEKTRKRIEHAGECGEYLSLDAHVFRDNLGVVVT